MRTFEDTIKMAFRHNLAKEIKIFIKIDNAKELFYQYLRHFLNENGEDVEPKIDNAYTEVIEWLRDNKGKSLYLYGNNGRGKTLIASKIIPAIYIQAISRIFEVVRSIDICEHYERIKNYKFLTIDDFGAEALENNVYGNKRSYINELIDSVEFSQKILVITSNFGKKEIIDKYGVRTFDRIIGNFKRVKFGGEGVISGEDSFRR